ncbi:hypothetical protein [Marimonas arenosa]|uniref:hypothetical protein n=1 Tax=Marimonas arenosa TaxID=1795305 RepID=UPI0027D23B33|nr:hypothetical protein [Marimonas arenosa]
MLNTPVLLGCALVAAALGVYPSNLGHIETTPFINVIFPIISCVNPVLGMMSALVFALADFAEKMVTNNIYYEGEPGTLFGNPGDYIGARIGYLLGYSMVAVWGVLPGLLSRVFRTAAQNWTKRRIERRSIGAAAVPTTTERAVEVAASAIGAATGGGLANIVNIALEAPAFLLRPTPDFTCYNVAVGNLTKGAAVTAASAGIGGPIAQNLLNPGAPAMSGGRASAPVKPAGPKPGGAPAVSGTEIKGGPDARKWLEDNKFIDTNGRVTNKFRVWHSQTHGSTGIGGLDAFAGKLDDDGKLLEDPAIVVRTGKPAPPDIADEEKGPEEKGPEPEKSPEKPAKTDTDKKLKGPFTPPPAPPTEGETPPVSPPPPPSEPPETRKPDQGKDEEQERGPKDPCREEREAFLAAVLAATTLNKLLNTVNGKHYEATLRYLNAYHTGYFGSVVDLAFIWAQLGKGGPKLMASDTTMQKIKSAIVKRTLKQVLKDTAKVYGSTALPDGSVPGGKSVSWTDYLKKPAIHGALKKFIAEQIRLNTFFRAASGESIGIKLVMGTEAVQSGGEALDAGGDLTSLDWKKIADPKASMRAKTLSGVFSFAWSMLMAAQNFEKSRKEITQRRKEMNEIRRKKISEIRSKLADAKDEVDIAKAVYERCLRVTKQHGTDEKVQANIDSEIQRWNTPAGRRRPHDSGRISEEHERWNKLYERWKSMQ